MGGTRLLNPWNRDGTLVALRDYPRLARQLRASEPELRARHVGRRTPDRWWRTIDRVIPGLANRPKLLFPDLRHRVLPSLEDQGLYPHHNLFWLISDEWDLRILGGLLLSDVGTMFVETYSPRMAGGHCG